MALKRLSLDAEGTISKRRPQLNNSAVISQPQLKNESSIMLPSIGHQTETNQDKYLMEPSVGMDSQVALDNLGPDDIQNKQGNGNTLWNTEVR